MVPPHSKYFGLLVLLVVVLLVCCLAAGLFVAYQAGLFGSSSTLSSPSSALAMPTGTVGGYTVSTQVVGIPPTRTFETTSVPALDGTSAYSIDPAVLEELRGCLTGTPYLTNASRHYHSDSVDIGLEDMGELQSVEAGGNGSYVVKIKEAAQEFIVGPEIPTGVRNYDEGEDPTNEFSSEPAEFRYGGQPGPQGFLKFGDLFSMLRDKVAEGSSIWILLSYQQNSPVEYVQLACKK